MKIKDFISIDYPSMQPKTSTKFIAGCVAGTILLAFIALTLLLIIAVLNKPILLIFVAFVGLFGWLAATDRI